FAEAEALSAAMAEPAPVTIRANTLKISRDQLMDRLIAEGAIASPCPYSPFGITLASSPLPPYQLSPFRDGFMTVQDESSQLATMLLSPQAGERILDLCAAPGGKATLLAQLMNNQGEVVAADKGERKLPLITQNANRLGVDIITLLRHDATQPLSPEVAKGGFHRVLIDPPCSGLGVIRRHPEAKWRTTPADFERLPLLQQTILEQGARYLKPDGTLLYATCTTTNQENEGVVDDFLSRHPEFVVEELQTLFPHLRDLITDRGFFRSWPHRHAMDGFFAARLRRR
ncbi:MAG TPA: methyltransferase domain-containing protein, partial [Geobacterales bacterium]|nr:methyltransferase domain-containing protein [Geobacterales bacterium]